MAIHKLLSTPCNFGLHSKRKETINGLWKKRLARTYAYGNVLYIVLHSSNSRESLTANIEHSGLV